jgi:hypothetical protein
MAVGCTHAGFIDRPAWEQVLAFKRRWRPVETIHLGDFLDTACWRAGARKDPDEPDRAASFSDDYLHGMAHLKELEVTTCLQGNHEARLWSLVRSPSAVVAYAAEQGTQAIEQTIKKLKARLLPYDIEEGLFLLGDTVFLHGFQCSVSAVRDTVESIGKNIVMAHLHRPEIARGRVLRSPVGICVGTLANIGAMGYARARRATYQWGHGFAYGEYCQDACVSWLATPVKGEWRFPV